MIFPRISVGMRNDLMMYSSIRLFELSYHKIIVVTYWWFLDWLVLLVVRYVWKRNWNKYWLIVLFIQNVAYVLCMNINCNKNHFFYSILKFSLTYLLLKINLFSIVIFSYEINSHSKPIITAFKFVNIHYTTSIRRSIFFCLRIRIADCKRYFFNQINELNSKYQNPTKYVFCKYLRLFKMIIFAIFIHSNPYYSLFSILLHLQRDFRFIDV